MDMSHSQDLPTVPSQDHSSSSTGLSIPFSHKSHGPPLQSHRRLPPTPDEPSSPSSLSILSDPDQPSPLTRVSSLGPASERDRNSCSDSFFSKHSFSEDLNNYPPSLAFSISRPNSPDSGSINYNEPFSSSLPTRASKLVSTSSDSLSNRSFGEDSNNFAPSSAFVSASRPNSLDSGSFNYNQPFSPEHLGTSALRQSESFVYPHPTSSSPAENRPPLSVTSASSATLVS